MEHSVSAHAQQANRMTTTLLIGTTGMLSVAAAHAVARSKKAVLVSRNADRFS